MSKSQQMLQSDCRYIEAGAINVPEKPRWVATVAASGIVVTIYDGVRKIGGITHYTHPIRSKGMSNPRFAAPAIVGLVRKLESRGCHRARMEVHFYGAAENNTCARYDGEISKKNIQVGEEVLQKLNIVLSGKDVGGIRARKIMFNSQTGETVVARVNNVRSDDWYPAI